MITIMYKVYLATMAITLVSDMLVTVRSQYYGISLGKRAALTAIITAALPIANLIVAFDNFTMLFDKEFRFIVRFLIVKGRTDELRVVDEDGNEVDFDIEKFIKGE